MSFDFITIPNYIPDLEQLAKQEAASNPSVILEKFSQAIKIQPPKGSVYEKAILRTFGELVQLSPGRAFLEHLTQALKDKVLIICDSTTRAEAMPEFVPESNTLSISSDISIFYVENGVLIAHPFSLTLVHELFHAMHFNENPSNARNHLSSSKNLLHPDFRNQEEQLTITGLLEKTGTVDLCENVFLHIHGLPLRSSHRQGLLLKATPNKDLRLDQLIVAQAAESVKTHISEAPQTVNQLYTIDWMEGVIPTKDDRLASKRLLPLSIAIVQEFDEIVEYLLQMGAQLELDDDLGGPILAACSRSNYQLATKLVELAVKK